MIKNYFWLVPFICFLCGYWFLFFLLPQKTIQAPHIVGLPIGQAALALANQNLNLRIIAQKDEQWAQQEIILSQNPKAGSSIKENQPVYCVISTMNKDIVMPNFIGKQKNVINQWCKKHGLNNQLFSFASEYPPGICFVQTPEAGEIITNPNEVIIYISKKNLAPTG